MHENTGQIQLHLETDVHISSIHSRGPPEGESSIRDLVKPRSLSMGQFLEFHRLFEPGGFLPEKPFPSGEVGTFEQRMFQNTFNSS